MNDYISPPGDTIQETIDFFGLSRGMLAITMGKDLRFIERLILGDIEIDLPLAIQLEEVLSIPREFWINREQIYRNKIKQLGETE
jgi:HTH-type transcriptional regulator/antitoxin HigA